MAQGGLSRLAIARLKSAGVPVTPLLKRVGLTPELIADPKERLSVGSQIAFLDEAAKALKDDCIGFTLARDFDLRELGLQYYVMASSVTLGEALKRLARRKRLVFTFLTHSVLIGFARPQPRTTQSRYSCLFLMRRFSPRFRTAEPYLGLR